MQRTILFALFAAIFATDAAPAYADNCGLRADIVGQLGSKYSEATSSLGIASNGALVEVLTSEDASTWTIIASLPSGISCLLAAGTDWADIAKITPEGPQL